MLPEIPVTPYFHCKNVITSLKKRKRKQQHVRWNFQTEVDFTATRPAELKFHLYVVTSKLLTQSAAIKETPKQSETSVWKRFQSHF